MQFTPMHREEINVSFVRVLILTQPAVVIDYTSFIEVRVCVRHAGLYACVFEYLLF